VKEVTDIIIGARGDPVTDVDDWMRKLRGTASARGLTAQAVDASAVCGTTHLHNAMVHARRAFDRGSQFSRSLEVEWVLCTAGVRQVGTAFQRVGIKPDCREFALLLISEDDDPDGTTVPTLLADLGLSRDDGVLECTREALINLGVTEVELETTPEDRWVDLALERTALLDLER
jgi:tRNA threonylcarbamoyladenosine modification (KEOPS) complex Cgi121 subunit